MKKETEKIETFWLPIGTYVLSDNTVRFTNKRFGCNITIHDVDIRKWRNHLMAYGKSRKQNTSARLTGLFKTKRPGLYVGSVAAGSEQLDALIEKIKEAKTKKKGLAFFMWKNDVEKVGPKGPVFSLSTDLDQEQTDRPKRKNIEPDDDIFGDDGANAFGDD